MIEISNEISIPEEELRFTASLSGGPLDREARM